MRIEQHIRELIKGKSPGTRKDGIRLDKLIDFLTTAQANGVPDGASVIILSDYGSGCAVEIHWTEDR